MGLLSSFAGALPYQIKPEYPPGTQQWVCGAIADIAVMKRHRLDKIFIYFYLHLELKELSKVVFKKTVSGNTPAKLYAIMFAQHTLVINTQEMRMFHTSYICYKCVHF